MKKCKKQGTVFLLACLALVLILPADRMYAAGTAAGNTYEIRIVSTSDIHARAASSGSGYGFEKIKTIAAGAEKESDMMLLLDAGDLYHGQAFATLTKGESIAELAAATGYDAVCAGNHDWSYGREQLRTLERLTAKNNASGNFALLAGNVTGSSGEPFASQEFLIKEMPVNQGNTVRVGVFGLIDPKLYTGTSPSNVEGLVFGDMAGYARQAVAALEAEGCDIILGMAHCINPAALAASVSGVDLWIAGHEHVSLQELVTDREGKQVYVLEAGYYGSEVDVTRLNFSCVTDGSGACAISGLTVTPASYKEDQISQTASDEEIAALYQSLSEAQTQILQEEAGVTPVKLEAGWEAVRIGETTMGRLITNAYLKETGADIAIENAGGIRTGRDIEAGTVTKADVIDTFPYGNYVVTKEITGSQLKELLELSIDTGIRNYAASEAGEYDGWPEDSGSYLQTGGMEVRFDASAPQGSRIRSLLAGGLPVEDTGTYTVAVNNYAAGSGDYPMLAASEIQNEYSACDEILIRYLQQTEAAELDRALATVCMIQEKNGGQSQDDRPAATSIKKLKAKSRGFQAVWNKSPSAAGYQIQYSETKKFHKKTTWSKTAGSQSVKKTVKGLKPQQTYYVRIRTYQTEEAGTVYSGWSGIKKVTTGK